MPVMNFLNVNFYIIIIVLNTKVKSNVWEEKKSTAQILVIGLINKKNW